jgi:hypothetical protein
MGMAAVLAAVAAEQQQLGIAPMVNPVHGGLLGSGVIFLTAGNLQAFVME